MRGGEADAVPVPEQTNVVGPAVGGHVKAWESGRRNCQPMVRGRVVIRNGRVRSRPRRAKDIRFIPVERMVERAAPKIPQFFYNEWFMELRETVRGSLWRERPL